ncbi:auxin-responsive protein SAUR32-like [Zingiber officinale]|nr:auxin-responsive protein SAUR32-like [Zingiber officinale]
MPGIHMQMLHRVAIGGGGGRRGCAAVPPPPRGWMAVRVGSQGEEQQRFVVPVGYLNHPLFLALLRAAEEEYGFHHSGAITLPCHVEHFRQVQGIIDRDTSTSADHRHHHHHFHLCFRA